MSRNVVANLFYSVDGAAADPYLFQHDSFDDDLGRLMEAGIAAIDTNLMGRVTYTEWAGYWPTATDGPDAGFADFINTTPKLVASRTLRASDFTWNNASLIEGNLLDHVRALKEQPGGDIAVQGSLSVTRQLVETGLMDRLTLIVHPAVAGTGRHLFDGAAPTRLTLLGAESTTKGNLVVTYGPHQG